MEMIDTLTTSDFSVLPDDLAAQYRLRYQRRQTLKSLVFTWQGYQLALPMIAAQKVIPISSSVQEEMILSSYLDLNGAVTQIVTLPRDWAYSFGEDNQEEEDNFILLFTIPDGRLLGLPIPEMPNVVELPLHWFSAIDASTEDLSLLPFRSWIKFIAQPNLDEHEDPSSSTFYLVDLDLLQIHVPTVDLGSDFAL